jgi:hypothetical protein
MAKTIKWDDLRKYGINPLTGEACPFGQRILTDLTERGKRIVLDMLGIPSANLSSNRNGGAAFSMIILRDLFQQLYAWCLINDGIEDVIVSDDGVVGREPEDTDQDWPNYYDDLARYRKNPRQIRANSDPAMVTAWSTPCRAGASNKRKEIVMPRTMKQLAQEAIDIQNACNGIGVAQGFARSTLELLNKTKFTRISEHPIWSLSVSKLHDLATWA